ncbi:LysM domain-containing protein [Lactobacillus sp. CBA3605]|uniref:aggregation-promoting factor n=1 Tax=Lactobacillus sp. CBA3605 TaxID=2099788 RepID=UPI000CFB2219|nr:LysM domain-containing protein [Lactobacillus sp. CBA3605]AVK62103.1 LysM domain-containing protein [Lactobacillus sp. CBA3605]
MKIKNLLLSTMAATGLLVVTTTAVNADTITVKAGDTVSAIAHAHQTTISSIETANSLANVNLIYVGQQLTVNGTTTVAEPSQVTATPSQNQNKSVAQPVTPSAPVVAEAPTSAPATTAPVAETTSNSDSAAKAWIANKESGGSYSARNGQYIGKYQLSAAYLNGDYSAANQEQVANNYVASRYGSWTAAQSFWQANGWY